VHADAQVHAHQSEKRPIKRTLFFQRQKLLHGLSRLPVELEASLHPCFFVGAWLRWNVEAVRDSLLVRLANQLVDLLKLGCIGYSEGSLNESCLEIREVSR